MEANQPIPIHLYRYLALVSLLRRVVLYSDRLALNEFHECRTPFTGRKGRPVRCVEYIADLRNLELEKNNEKYSLSDETIYEGHDITIDRFSRLGQSRDCKGNDGHPAKGVDCRLYIRAFLHRLDQILASSSPLSSLQEESLACRLLQKHVQWHFRLSLMEARRRTNPMVSRYEWVLPGGSLYLWFPVDFPGHERRAWLEQHIEDPDPQRIGKARVQACIDRLLCKGRIQRIGNDEFVASASSESYCDLSWALQYGITRFGLAEVVANEKAAGIRYGLRPAIRALGAARLRELIKYVFENLDSEDYSDEKVAARFQMSKASFSRFCGSRWHKRSSAAGRDIPDLWRNLCLTLAHHSGYVEAAKAAGVWPRVKRIVDEISQHT